MQQGWVLVVVDGADVGREYPLRAEARLGRSDDNEVQLSDPQVSRHHALLRRSGGGWTIEDIGSSNGTFVDGRQIGGPVRLCEGNAVRVANTMLRLVVRSQAAAGHSAPTPAPARVPTPVPPPVPAGPPAGGAPVGVISFVERRKGLLRTETFAVVITADRLVFARVTADMIKAATEQARSDAKAQGKGFFGQWGAQLGAGASFGQRYYGMTVDAILREHPDNFQLPLGQIQKVQVKHGRYDDQQRDPDYLVIHAGGKMRLTLKGTDAGSAKKALRQVLGDRVK